ncbi:MAG TPA: N-acetylmuramoyl-L-alanine amidase [candidate division Zixibacteria bacterium]|nr:N-acetylmuramoyl-L-alanine amidase [candidate division Zixibacteria bacterium]
MKRRDVARGSALLVLVALWATCAQAEVDALISGRTEKVASYQRGDVTYLSLSGLVEFYGEKLSWDIPGQSVDYRSGEDRFRLFIGSPFVSLNDTVRHLTYPVEIKDGQLFVPAVTFVRLLDRSKSEHVIWENDRRRLRIETAVYNITDLAVSEKNNGLLIELYVTESLTFEITESEGAWLNINLPDGRVNRAQVQSRRSYKQIRDVNAFQFEKSAQVSFRLYKQPESFTAKYDPVAGRIQIAIRNPNFKPTQTSRPVGQIGPGNTVDLIVIDPGHGGEDNGAIGRGLTKEKDVALEIARELAKLIREEKRFKVILTRDRDVFVPLEKRAAIANEAHADLFISIHANASLNRQAQGSQVFFLAPAKNDAARALAQAENASFLTTASMVDLAPSEELSVILNDMIQNSYEEVSSDLSDILQSEMRRSLRIPARGVDQAGFVVLNEVFMPSALVEVAFISNPSEEKLLADKSFRKKVAAALYEGLKRFKKKYEKSG